ncbi:unnamed protein product [Symbiodinium pilosum]|uniref:Uncharacterized protein n=1 Tax=Symbiodinium pilosum TaxID=2952 RepID=A0A812N222_SYMPI|nr:unnamed protein product [Symbiodinium pilosum]
MKGFYEQRSCTDTSPTWELSEQGSLEQVPNLKAKWILDEETVLTCCHYAGNEAAESWVDATRLSERFGSETLECMGGLGVLLEFIGLICADAGAPSYASLLPFGLPEVRDFHVECRMLGGSLIRP